MPDHSCQPCDQASGHVHGVPGHLRLPASGAEAGLRGALGKCPRCGEARLFARFIKPVSRCPHCGQDWTLQRADDFPAYVAIFLTGHILAPLIILLVVEYEIPAGMLAAIILSLATLMLLALLQPAKGCIIALQWWLGLHGFQRERAAGED